MLNKILSNPGQVRKISKNLYVSIINEEDDLVNQTQSVFSKKWDSYKEENTLISMEKNSKDRFLKLYGFADESDFKDFLKDMDIIYDAGCGRGDKAAWIAGLNPNAFIIAMDISDSVVLASKRYESSRNLVFIKGDISKPFFKSNVFDLVICDQVLHHTKNPPQTLQELSRLIKQDGWLLTYVYAKKAVPRELLDSYFRDLCRNLSHQELMEFSEQITILGKILSELRITIDVPDIPLLKIKGGKWGLQRFIYYNFIKCFWNERLGWHNSVMTNYDWYSPGLAYRYSEEEFKEMIENNGLRIEFFYKDEMASYSSRLKKDRC